MKQRGAFFPVFPPLLLSFLLQDVAAQYVRRWSSNTSQAWLIDSNWSALSRPGSATSNANNDVALFDNMALNSNSLGIQMNTSSAVYSLGAIHWNMTVGESSAIGNSSTVNGSSGSLRLNGASVHVGSSGGSISNLLIGIGDSATTDLTIQNAVAGGNRTMTLRLGSSSGTMYVAADRTLTINTVISQSVSNSGFSKAGAGTLVMSAANSFNGVTVVSEGTLRATNNATVLGRGAASLLLDGGTLELANDSNLNYARNTSLSADSTISVDRLSASSASITHTLGRLTMGANCLTIARGAQISDDGIAGINFSATTLVDEAVFHTQANTQLTLGAVGGDYGLIKNGSGKMILVGTHTFTGVTTIEDGVLEVQGSMEGSSGIHNNSHLIFHSELDHAFDATISGRGSMTKDGSGTLTISGNHTFEGGTKVSAGTLYVTGALASGTVVDANGTLGSLGANARLENGLTILSGGTLDLTGASLRNNAGSDGILTLASGSLTLGNLTFADLIGWDWSDASAGTYKIIDGDFNIDWGSTAYLSPETAFDLGNGKSGYFTAGSLNVVIIPETSVPLLTSAAALLLLLRRKRI